MLTRFGLAVFFLAIGVLHLTFPRPFLKITPDWVPFAPVVIALTGAAELAGGAGLLIPRLRKAAGIGLAVYAVFVFPANVNHALDQFADGITLPELLYHPFRFALQPIIFWAALWASGAIEWPFAPPSKPYD